MELSVELEKVVHLADQGDFIAAKSHSREIIKFFPHNDNGYALLAICCANLALWKESEKAARRAIALGNNQFNVIHTLGKSLINMEQLNDAQEVIEGLFNQTGELELLTDIALIQQRKGNFVESIEILEKLIELKPDNLAAPYYKSLIEIFLGRFDDCWNGYNNRFQVPGSVSNNPVWVAPKWNGENLVNKSILVWFEQGMGDQLIMASCLNDLAKLAKDCTLICDKRNRRIFAESFPQIFIPQSESDFVTLNASTHKYDFELLGGDIFGILRKGRNKFSEDAYLKVPNFESEKVKQKIKPAKLLNVGISWFGGDTRNTNNRWSITVKELKQLFSIPGVNWINLQFGEFESDRMMIEKKYKTKLQHYPEYAASCDFYDHGKLVSALDLIISVDNAAAVFSAALGKEVWVMTPADPFWCWTLDEKNPWFKNVKSFTRQYEQDWRSVISRVSQALTKKVESNLFS